MKRKSAISAIAMAIAMAIAATIAGAIAAVPMHAQSIFPAPAPNYLSFMGTIKEVSEPPGQDATTILVENKEGAQVAFQVDGSTVRLTDVKAEAGASLTGFYDAKTSMLTIYPPRPHADVIAVGLPEDKSVKVDIFNTDLISEDGALKLNISPDTQIFLADGAKFDGELTGRRLAVLYGIATLSLPGVTTPDKIIALFEKPATPIYTLTDEEKASLGSESITALPPLYTLTEEDQKMLAQDAQGMNIVANGKTIEAPKPYLNEVGVIMLPVRAAAEAMGLTVEWFPDTQTIQVGQSAFFSLDKDAYAMNRMAPKPLGTAPVLKDGITFVPLDFFQTILKASVSISSGNIELQI
ncbi:MAG: copper amine oxidase N-terminal domain-containing protein [Clostridiales bacterium]|jgi:hypothetical protein|nr:copper amine oxidase N-terminal domain-containing protein [Clostridiales bacterium]